MKLVKDGNVFTTEDATVIRAFKQNGYTEAKAEDKKPQPKPTTKKAKD